MSAEKQQKATESLAGTRSEGSSGGDTLRLGKQCDAAQVLFGHLLRAQVENGLDGERLEAGGSHACY